jgi:signal peptidase I
MRSATHIGGNRQQSRGQKEPDMRTVLSVVGGILLLVVALAALFGFRAFAFQPFNIPSGSMEPTILPGEMIFVSKYNYGYGRYSLPFAPPSDRGRVFPADPQLGDVVVFRIASDARTDYIKRVAGLPGDRVQLMNGVLSLNGEPAKRERLADFIVPDAFERGAPAKRWRETLPNGAGYEVIQIAENSPQSNTNVFEVPPGYFFALGDNRDNSLDSRFASFGFVPLDNLVGRAQIVFWSPHAKRIGARVR